MFKSKKQPRMDIGMESGTYRLVVDYFDVKDKIRIREALYACIAETYGDLLLQVDSAFMNKKISGKEGSWIDGLIQWIRSNGLLFENFTFRREVPGSVLGGLLGSKVPVAGYRVGALIGKDHIMEAVLRHKEIDMGVHVGCGLVEAARETLLKEFCSGIIDEFNFSNYYAIDFYDYDMVGRCVLKSSSRDLLEAAKTELESRFLCFKNN